MTSQILEYENSAYFGRHPVAIHHTSGNFFLMKPNVGACLQALTGKNENV